MTEWAGVGLLRVPRMAANAGVPRALVKAEPEAFQVLVKAGADVKATNT